MRRVTKQLLIFLAGILFTVVYCEFLIYYVVVAQCKWPSLDISNGEKVLKTLIIADTHLLGPYRGHWLDKWRREWQMHQAFQAIISIHRPEVVFVLGDLFDEGEWTNGDQFKAYVERFNGLFYVPDETVLYSVAGNHDIGFHNYIRRGSAERFEKSFDSPPVKHLQLSGNHFVLLISMAMEGDSCNLCTRARQSIEKISESLKTMNNSRTILLQHFPLFRKSDEVCVEPDAPPFPQRQKKFRPKIDSLSNAATDYVVTKLRPRAVFGGHTHHGCLLHHTQKQTNIEFYEYSVPSFSWRNRPDPKYMLVSITENNYAVNKCGLPMESTIVLTAGIFLIGVFVCAFRRKLIGRR